MNILVTGGSGFIGSYVCRFLAERGDYVVNLDTMQPRGERAYIIEPVKDSIIFEYGGVEDLPAIINVIKKHRITKIAHIAAVVNPPLLQQQPTIAYRVNIGGIVNVLETSRLMGLERIVYISSIGALTSKRYEPLNEEHPVLLPDEGPGSGAYGAAKVAGECFCWSYHQSYGVDFIALRPSAVYGLSMQYPIYIKPMVENAVKGAPTKFRSGGDLPRDYTYVKDVAQVILLSLDLDKQKLKDRIFLIGTGKKLVTPSDLVSIIRRFIPEADIEVGPGIEEWDKHEIRYRGIIDIRRAREQLGYNPQYDIIKGVEDYIESYQTYLKETKSKI
ncbi:NAD-dependent epimerase/dehydratase family protein [[Eubacterium] cellulosolvens]